MLASGFDLLAPPPQVVANNNSKRVFVIWRNRGGNTRQRFPKQNTIYNFSPQRYFIWNNRCILYKHKSIFLKNWFDKGIVLVSHLFNNQG